MSAMQHLLPLFHMHFRYCFSFIDVSAETHRNQAPQLLNIMCALAARYSPFYGKSTTEPQGTYTESGAAHVWASKAKEQVMHGLAISTMETVETMLLLSWYEFGQDRDTVSCPLARRIDRADRSSFV